MALMTGEQYIESMRKLNLQVYMFGKKIDNVVDDPILRPSLNSVRMTYDLAQMPEYEDLMTATSSLTGKKINRFTHIHQSTQDLINRVRMQRLLGQKTAACFQRCVGMDASNAVFSTTYEIDQKYGTHYHEKLQEIPHPGTAERLYRRWRHDRPERRPRQGSSCPDDRMRISTSSNAVPTVSSYAVPKPIRQASSTPHEVIVMPTIAMREADKGLRYFLLLSDRCRRHFMIVGRQSCDTRKLEGAPMDTGNLNSAAPPVIFDNVFIPNDQIFLNGEVEFAGMMVERFAGYHRQSWRLQVGVGDVPLGPLLWQPITNGCAKASHQRQDRRNAAPERNPLRLRHCLLGPGQTDEIGQLPHRPAVGQRVQAERHPVPL